MAASTDADRIARILADHLSFDWERRIVEMLQKASVSSDTICEVVDQAWDWRGRRNSRSRQIRGRHWALSRHGPPRSIKRPDHATHRETTV